MKKILLLSLMILLMGNVLGAVETLGIFQQGTNVELLQSGANFSFCNITSVRDPDSYSLIENVQMTKDGNEYNYTLNSSYTAKIGNYIVNGFCSNGTTEIVWAYDLKVTPSGKESSTGESILYFLFTILVFGFLVLLFYFSFATPHKNEKDDRGRTLKIIKLKYLRVFFISLIYPTIIVLLNLLNGLAVNFTTLTIFSGTLGFLFEMMLRLAWIWTLIIIAWIVVYAIQDTNAKKMMRKIRFICFN